MKKELQALIEPIKDWHKATFPRADFLSQMGKWTEELHELSLEAYNTALYVEELADMFIVACGMRRFNQKVSDKMFFWIENEHKKVMNNFEKAVSEKMEKNRKRDWIFENDIYHHRITQNKKVKKAVKTPVQKQKQFAGRVDYKNIKTPTKNAYFYK